MAMHITGILLIGGALTLAPTAAWAETVARLAPAVSEQAAIPFARGTPAATGRIEIERILADPSTRSSPCLCEYAWDFTDPHGVPGFGPPADPDPPR